jgi:hypothetical protein
MRLLRRSVAALALLGLIGLVLAGCRSNAQQDLIARELRMQEDQLYAMEDYISQYQQLVCKYRMENAALRRQMTNGYDVADELPQPDNRRGLQDDRNTPSTGPTFREPETPKRNGAESSETPIDLPDVPPLEGSTTNKREANVSLASFASANDSTDTATVTGAQGDSTSVPVNERNGNQFNHSMPLSTDQPATTLGSSNDVLLRGEVLANDGGGPRLVVDVQRLDPVGGAVKFDGTISLMLLARDDKDQPQNLARWDFDVDDVRSAVDPSAGEHGMRFYLELPADTPIGQATEIWVRLLPRDGMKVLAHTRVNLQQSSAFSSGIADPPRAPALAVASHSTTTPHDASDSKSNLGTGEWTTARPGQLRNLPSETTAGQWRASSETMPVVQSAFATAALPQPVQRAAYSEIAPRRKSARTFARPTWSPDRNSPTTQTSESKAAKPDTISRRPIWSADR